MRREWARAHMASATHRGVLRATGDAIHTRFRTLFAMLTRNVECGENEAAETCFRGVQALRTNARNAKIRFDRDARCYALVSEPGANDMERRPRRRLLKGATTFLGETLMGSAKRAREVDRRYWAKGPRRATLVPCRGAGGASHGSTVHRQVELLIRMMTSDTYNAELVCDFDPCVFRLLNACLAEGWLPVESEFKLWDGLLGIGSAIDLVCIDVDRHRIVLVELKNGYDDARYAAIDERDRMCAPFADIPASPYFRHTFQVLLYKLMLVRNYELPADLLVPVVVQVSARSGTSNVYPLPAWADDERTQDAIYAHFACVRGVTGKRKR